MPRDMLPGRRRTPWIGQPPPFTAPAVTRRVVAATVIAALGMAGSARGMARGAVLQVKPPRPQVIFAPSGARDITLVQIAPRFQRGQALIVRPPRPLVVFAAGAVRQADIVRRDERGFAGRVLFARPPRPQVFFAPAAERAAQVVRRDERRFVGALKLPVPPRPLVVFGPPVERTAGIRQKPDARFVRGQALFVQPPRLPVVFGPATSRAAHVWQRPDSRWQVRAQGQVWRSLPSRTAAVVIQERLQPPTVAKRTDFRFTPGRVVAVVPPRPLVVFGPAGSRAPHVWQQPDRRYQRGQVLVVRPERLQPGRSTRPAIIVRQDRRGFLGRGVMVVPPRPQVVFGPATARQSDIWRAPDARFQRGLVQIDRPHGAPVLARPPISLVVRSDRRGFGGRLFLGVRRAGLAATQPRPRPPVQARRDERGFRGRVLVVAPVRPRVVFGAADKRRALTVVRAWTPYQNGRVFWVRAALPPVVGQPGHNTRATLSRRAKVGATLTRRAKPTAEFEEV